MATCSGHFTNDLVLQIVPLLPLKSQARFKSLSRQWRSLISNDPRPVRALLLDMHLLPLDTNTTTYKNHQLSLPFHGHCLELLQSCNGLLLFKTSYQYEVHNPLTGQYAALPVDILDYEHVTTTLAYDPSKSPHYKLLQLCTSYISIYSSQTSRCCFHEIDILHFLYPRKSSLYWNGSVYYVCEAWNRKDLYSLYRFDVERELMLEAPLPQDDDFKTSSLKRLVESWGRLYILGVSDARGQELKVYEMERDHSAWRLKYHLQDFGRDLKIRFCRSGNDLKIRLGGGKIFRVWSDGYRVFFPAPEMGGEEEIWLVLTRAMLVYRYGLGGKSVVTVNALKPHRPRHWNFNLTAHEFAESILELPQPPFEEDHDSSGNEEDHDSSGNIDWM